MGGYCSHGISIVPYKHLLLTRTSVQYPIKTYRDHGAIYTDQSLTAVQDGRQHIETCSRAKVRFVPSL